MTLEEVKALVHEQAIGNFSARNDHRITLNQALRNPHRISVIARSVRKEHVAEEYLDVWLVGQEEGDDGYKIIMNDDGSRFGLASKGLPVDKYPILVGWYGSLVSAFLSM